MILACPFCELKGIKSPFYFRQFNCGIILDVRLSTSPGMFKHLLFYHFNFSQCNPLFYMHGDRLQSIFHTRLRLKNSTLNYDLILKNCIASPACARCGANIEDVKHYSLSCPVFAALRTVLLTSASHLLRDKWRLASDKKKIKLLLSGDPDVDFQTNVNLFRCVQSFISQTNRFS